LKGIAWDCVSGAWRYNLDQRDVAALLKEDRLFGFSSDVIAKEVNEVALNSPSLHDSINLWVCIVARSKRHRVSIRCASCKGRGYEADRSVSAKIARWRKTDPPAGEGWQIWETVTEGSPKTPVFATPEALARYCTSHCIMDPLSYARALKWITESGWAPTAIASDGIVEDGVAFYSRASAERWGGGFCVGG
jgi:hypothetical protein